MGPVKAGDSMPNLTSLLALMLMHTVAVVSPGPDFAIVVRNSLIFSRSAGVFTALGVAAAVWIHVFYSALGLGYLIDQIPWLLNVIKVLGCSYLIYIGYKGLRSQPMAIAQEESSSATEVEMCSNGKAFRQGFWTNLLNAKAILYFISFFTVFLQKDTPLLTLGIYGSVIVGITLGWFLIVAYCLSVPVLQKKFKSGAHWIDRVTGVVLISLGLKLALTSLI